MVALLALVVAVGGYVPLALLSPLAPAAADVAGNRSTPDGSIGEHVEAGSGAVNHAAAAPGLTRRDKPPVARA